MKLTYAYLKGCKRFTLSNISEIEAHFKSNVQVIVGSNGSGKSSFMQELCPIPSVRTDYLPGGRKELHIEHEGHLFIVGSDFGNRTSPHSFIMDDDQLNISGTTDVQTELVEKHFGITSAIRNLIYAKTPLCTTSKAERKNLFLNINPMELGLILDTHKRAYGRVKDCKANLQLLNSRKAELESKMLPTETLQLHKQTKDRRNEELLAIDKLIYGLEQHINMLQEKFRDDLEYKRQCSDSNTQIIPSELILSNCKRLMREAYRFSSIERDQNHVVTQERLKSRANELQTKMTDIQRTSQQLAAEINEYHKHLNTAAGRPISLIEKEIEDLDKELQNFQDIPADPIPKSLLDKHYRLLDEIREVLFAFRDASVKMIDPEILAKQFQDVEMMSINIHSTEARINQLTSSLHDLEQERQQNNQMASIPSECTLTSCGLRSIFSKRLSSLDQRYQKLNEEYTAVNAGYQEQKKKFDELVAQLRPFKDAQLLERYRTLATLLGGSYFKISPTDLLEKVQQQPMLLLAELTNFTNNSKSAIDKATFEAKRNELMTELQVIMKSSGASMEFLQNKVKEKEAAIKNSLSELASVETEITAVNEQYNLYLEYSLALGKIEEFQQLFGRGERAILVSKAVQYWNGLKAHIVNAKLSISEELRNLETLVREQETLRSTYQNETIALIGTIEKDKRLYEKIELALSPTTGIPHKSMVKYLNALIHNANYFISQIWSYRMKLLPIREDEPLSYAFPLETPGNIAADISQLSDGQTEVMNLSWVLTILLQLKLLNKLPFFADEIGRTFDPVHRVQILSFIGQLLDNKIIEQLFIVNHLALFTDGFPDCDVICLNPDNVPELPKTVNEHVRIVQ